MMSQHRILIAAFGLMIISCGDAMAQSAMPMSMPMLLPGTAQTMMVKIENFDFGPMDMTIAAGTTVTWKNLDEEPHTVASTSGLFHSNGLGEGETFSFKFDKPGVYTYICSIHPKMRATITVK